MSGETASLLTDEQIPIAPSLKAVHVSNGKRIRDLIVRSLSANQISQTTLARETGRENATITRMLSGEQGIGADVVAATLAHDHAGVMLQGLAAMCGWEAKRKEPDPVTENHRLREELIAIRERLARVLGEAM